MIVRKSLSNFLLFLLYVEFQLQMVIDKQNEKTIYWGGENICKWYDQ